MDKISQALQLLRMVNAKEISTKDAIGIIELITTVPELVKATLERAEREGLIKRKKGSIIISDAGIEFKSEIKRIKCDDSCKRCGRKITVCCYILLQDMEIGPLGTDCVRKLKLI